MKSMGRLAFIVKHLCIILLLTLLILIGGAPYHPGCRYLITTYLQRTLQNATGTHCYFDFKSLSILTPSIEIDNVIMIPTNAQYASAGRWAHHSKRYKIGFSWWYLLVNGILDLTIEISDLTAYSTLINDIPAITDMLKKIIEPGQPVRYRLAFFNAQNATILIHHTQKNSDIQIKSHCTLTKTNDLIKSKIHITAMDITLFGKSFITNLVGILALDAKNTAEGHSLSARIESKFSIPTAPTDYLFSGKWEHDHGRFSLRNIDDSCSINPIIITKRNNHSWLQANAQIPLEHIHNLAHHLEMISGMPSVGGLSFIRLSTCLDQTLSHMDINILLDNMRIANTPWNAITSCAITKRDAVWNSEMSTRIPGIFEVKGNGVWDQQTGEANGTLRNTTAMTVPYAPYWKIEAGSALCSLKRNAAGVIQGPFSCSTTNKLIRSTLSTQGTCTIDNAAGTIEGTIANHRYVINFNAKEFPFFKYAAYKNEKGVQLMEATCQALKTNTAQPSACFTSTLDIQCIRSLLEGIIKKHIQAEGTIALNGVANADTITTTLSLENGTIRLPHTYNFANKCNAHLTYHLPSKQLTITDARIDLYTGRITIPYGTVSIDNQYQLTDVFLPILLDHCLLNMHQELFAMISSHLILDKTASHPLHIQGTIILDKSHLKENIFAKTLQQQLAQHATSLLTTNQEPILCNISVETKEPIHVDTAFLQSTARANLSIKNKITDPEVTGTVKLLSGSLIFPYKPLHVTKGTLIFLPGQAHNPLLELSAKNSIKKHTVTLHVTGSLLNRHLIFESTPPLTDEQIVALLTVGSPQESLNVMAPALIMQNVQKLLFGTQQSSILERYFKPLTKQFSINLIPSFTDQSGRGGLRGALEIDINDNVRATIQKNFSLTEDTRFDIEYAATDDITIRGSRNERRDLGCEIEMKWKF
jgi:hypothetical protein